MISVIIPVYNREATICQAVNSVLNQTYTDLECIVVDDCSSDNTCEIIESINDERLRLIRLDKNSGACNARNIGISEAKGDYIAFQDSDDIWYNDKLEKQVEYLTKKQADICFCRYSGMVNNKHIEFPEPQFDSNDLTFETLLKRNFASTQTILCKKSCLYNIKFDEQLKRYQDWDLMIRLFPIYRAVYLKEILVTVTRGMDNITNDPVKGLMACEYMLDKYHEDYEQYPKSLSYVLSLMGTHYIQLNREKDAEETFKKAFELNKSNWKALIKLVLLKFGLLKYRYRKQV